MGRKKKSAGAQVVWMAAILMSLVIALFSVVYASVTDGGTGAGGKTSPGVSTPPSGSIKNPSASPGTVSPNGSGNPESSTPGTAPGSASANAVPDTPPPSPTEIVDYSSIVLGKTEDMGDTYLDKFVFFGDSTSNSGLLFYVLVGDRQAWVPKENYFGLFNQSITRIVDPATQEQMTIDGIFSQEKPLYVLITLGADGIAATTRERFISDYTALVKRIQDASPDTKIILNSIYPVTQTHSESGGDGVTMDRINAANDWIQKVAFDTNTRYLDSASALKNDAGFLPDKDSSGDGIHLTKDALSQVLQYLKTHGYPQGDTTPGTTAPTT